MGNKTKFKERVIERILEKIRSGLNEADAALMAGVCRTTWHEWKNKDPELEWREDRPKLTDALYDALIAFKEVHLKNIGSISKKGGRAGLAASMWLLQQKFNNEFCDRTRHHVTGTVNHEHRHAIQVQVKHAEKQIQTIPPTERRAMFAALTSRTLQAPKASTTNGKRNGKAKANKKRQVRDK